MSTVKIQFHRCIQDSQEFGSDDQHMVSRVFFGIEVDGQLTGFYTVDVKQAVGTDYSAAPLEVGTPAGYKGPFNYDRFRKCVEAYYRSLIGGGGSAIQIQGGARVRMRNNLFSMPSECSFDAEETSTKSW